MNKIISKITLLISSALMLVACASNFSFSSNNNQVISGNSNNQTTSSDISFSNNAGQTITSKEKFTDYSVFKRIDSKVKLVVEEDFDHVLETYEEAMAYKAILEEKSETVTDKDNGESIDTYSDMIAYLASLNPNQFENSVLYISPEITEMYYNKDSCRFEGMYIKDQTIYVHLYRDYMYKSLGFVIYQAYTFFVNKDVSFNKVEFDIEDLYLLN